MKMENNLCPSSHWAFYPSHISHFSLCDKAQLNETSSTFLLFLEGFLKKALKQ